MAVIALRGYDPTTLAWKNVPASTPEDSVPPTDIVDEGLFTVMALRKRRQQSNTAKASDTDKAKSAKTPHKKTSRVSWRPAAMPRTAAEDFTIVLKPRVTVDLKAAFQPGELGAKLASYANATNSDCISVWPIWAQNIIVVSTNNINTANLLSREFSLKTSQGPLPMIGHAKISGEVCRGVITVHEQETSASLKAKIHWRGGNIAFIRKLGKTSVALLTFEGHHVPRFVHYNSVVTPVREYKRTIPACYCCGTVGHRPELCPYPNDQRCGHCGQVVGEEHLTGSPACKAKFRRLQQTGGQHGGRGSPQQRPKPKTSDVTPEGRQPGATNQTPKSNQQVPHPPKTSQASQKTSSKTPDQGAPVFQAGEFPPLTSGGAPRQPAKKTSSQVGSWAGAASSSCSPSPTSSPKFLVLKQELAALRAQNAQLLVKIATLEAGSTPSTPASPPPPLPKITVAVPEPKPMCVAPSVSEPSNTEQRFQAIESAMTALVTQLTTMSKSIENLSNTVTHQVTSNIKTWLQDTNPRSRRASPLKDVNRPSKFSYTNDLAELSEDSESLLAQGTNVGAESIPATPNSQADPPVHSLNIYCRPKLKKITFADTFTRALKIAGQEGQDATHMTKDLMRAQPSYPMFIRFRIDEKRSQEKQAHAFCSAQGASSRRYVAKSTRKAAEK
ncbi:hypothetical protein HPB49_021285 [Dermacentor silvarum]|uniref:Uncharacterized protein n=1 Tax=Dermacentor silvarum TaxID=543639 RepID=A0ACB8E366_DERSI|nr:hypothetical protein HPB49_021285 [Dermacentor silvarum]